MPNIIKKQVLTDFEDYGAKNAHAWYMYALEETASAPRPSWKYTQAIFTRLTHDGVKGMTKKKPAPVKLQTVKQVTEQQYNQREYKDDSETLPEWMRRAMQA